jgi:2-oxoglutarate dehydrogenase E1 component
MYEQIRNHPSVVELYTKRLVQAGVVDETLLAGTRRARRAALEAALATARRDMPRQQVFAFGGAWQGLGWAGDDWSADTRVPAGRLRAIGEALARLPADFTPHPRIRKLLEERRDRIVRGEALDWGAAELLAYGSLLLEGTPVRVSGQDTVRGTFGHRHAAVYDAKDGRPWVPLDHVQDGQAALEAVNSPLSEAGVLGFEYGVSSGDPRRLTVWEAQFGDFVNGAQVVIDQFIAGGESKWQRMSGLVLLLPHGFEGQGAEHSSARPERFLQLCAEGNLQVIVPTTPAQVFHALRRQIHRPFRKPLVVMSPKSLLRHPQAVSPLRDLTDGGFEAVLDDPRPPAAARRLVLCAGKLFYALDAARRERGRDDVALVRVEQLYPFPGSALAEVLDQYTSLREIVWLQEEPENMGAWEFMRPLLEELIADRCPLRYIGRARSSSPSEGSSTWHQLNQKALVEQAFDSQRDAAEPSMVLSKQV